MKRKIKINLPFTSGENNHQPQTSIAQNSSFTNGNSESRSSLERTTPAATKVSHPKQKPVKTSSKQKRRKLRKNRKSRRINLFKRITIPTPIAFLCRLVIITVGISTIMGSVISIANSFNPNLTVKPPTLSSPTPTITETKSSPLKNFLSPVFVDQ